MSTRDESSISNDEQANLCPRNVIDGDQGEHFFKRGAFADSPIRCIYCGTKKAGESR